MKNPSNVWMPFTQMAQASAPTMVTSGKAAHLNLADGKQLIDAISSWWVSIHGHGNLEIAEAIYEQAKTLEHVIAAGYTHEPAQQLAAQLKAFTPDPLEWVFFSDDGSTAVEVALKMAFQYWANQQAKGRNQFLALEGGYHGDTLGAMSVGDPSLFSPVFSPLLFDVTRLPRPLTWEGDLEIEAKEAAALATAKEVLEQNPTGYAALIVEPLIQGAAGMRTYRPQFLRALVDLARSFGVLVIFDEVMTGFGRTGQPFASQTAEVEPDLMCLSKGLTGGTLPMAVTMASNLVYEGFLGDQAGAIDPTFYHGHSFTANPLGCAAAVASLKLLKQNKVYPVMESWHREGLGLIEGCERLSSLRVLGTMAAMDWSERPGAKYNNVEALKAAFVDRGVILRPLGKALYILPPYCIEKGELIYVYEQIKAVLDA